MHTVHSPRSGSLAVTPRKRCKNEIPSLKVEFQTSYNHDKPFLLVTKVGMIKYTDSTDNTSCATIFELPEIQIMSYIAYEKTRIAGLQNRGLILESEVESKNSSGFITTALVSFDFSKTRSGRKSKILREVLVKAPTSPEELISSIENSKVFNSRGVTKGHGFTGIVKRYGVKLKKRKHARANKTRLIGAISTRGLARVARTAPQAGNHGFYSRTIRNLSNVTEFTSVSGQEFKNYGIVKNKYIAVRGSIMGPVKRITILQAAV